MNLAGLLAHSAQVYPQRPAVFLGTRCLYDYRIFGQRAARIAGGLRGQHGLQPGDRVAVFMTNNAYYLETLYGIWWAGLVAVPVNAKLHPRELAWILDNAQAAAVFLSPDLADGVLDALAQANRACLPLVAGSPEYAALADAPPIDVQARDADDLAWLFYTSGTTGQPKGVMLTHRNLASMVSCYFTDVDDVHPDDAIVYGGGLMYTADIKRAIEVMGPRFVQIFGQGESPMTITALSREHLAARDHSRWAERLASVGVAQSLVQVRVADEHGQAVAPGAIGEVLVRGDIVMKGYWRNEAATASALRGGWLWTGDMGSLDEDGFLTLRDRSKDVIISGGSNIYPREVEEVLLRHPGVHEVSVVGQDDPDWGEVVVAFVVADAGTCADSLDALCLQEIARFKRPKHYRFVDELPKNNYGKVLKTALREQLGS